MMIKLLFFIGIQVVVVYVLLFLFYIVGLFKKKKNNVTVNYVPSVFVSIIVVARNEEKNVDACLQSLTNQSYDHNLFEIIIVDDDSSDRTAEKVLAWKEKYLQIKLLKQISNSGPAYKKKAIELAISQAIGSLIVTTDADCVMNKDWLKSIVCCYEQEHAKMILAPVHVINDKSILSSFQAMEMYALQAVTASATNWGIPFMSNGANFAYEKKIFEEVGGYVGVDHLASGDDVFLLKKIKEIYSTQIVFLNSNESVVYTHSVTSLKEFIHQRIRWASKWKESSSFLSIATAISVFAMNAFLLVVAIVSMLYSLFFKYFIATFLIKCSIDFLLVFLYLSYFKEKKMRNIFVLQLLYIPYAVFVPFCTFLFKQYNWKGRTIS